ncbi:hypothetical protein SAMN05444162_4335 [Paenibacillaceae bacterium GAS479]|nr:hypothetical protein SAMN05444162_4335 [Paenibacillaceae bacterium GAS479]
MRRVLGISKNTAYNLVNFGEFHMVRIRKKIRIPRIHKGLQTKNRDPLAGASFMGEEKPDEELMGKRKPSPRCLRHLSTPIITGCSKTSKYIHGRRKFAEMISDKLSLGTISMVYDHHVDKLPKLPTDSS